MNSSPLPCRLTCIAKDINWLSSSPFFVLCFNENELGGLGNAVPLTISSKPPEESESESERFGWEGGLEGIGVGVPREKFVGVWPERGPLLELEEPGVVGME